MPVAQEELLADIRRVAHEHASSSLTFRQYQQRGRFAPSTAMRRFGAWNAALMQTELAESNSINLPDDVLFENLLSLWQHYGRQPRRAELALPPSTISQTSYNRRFRSWSAALAAFVEFANGVEPAPLPTLAQATRKRTARDPSLRLRFQVLHRDRFSCCSCGVIPATTVGTRLQVDHIDPWGLGRETVFENLQTLCEPCNLGKSNVVHGNG